MQGKEDLGRMSLYLPIDLFRKIRQQAKKNRRSTNQEVVLIFEEFFKQKEEKNTHE